jgi:hypothetical protein
VLVILNYCFPCESQILARSPLSPPTVYRTGSQLQPTPFGSKPLGIFEEWQAYRYSHARLSVPVSSTLHASSSTPGSQYNPLYDNIEPGFGSKLFGSGAREHGHVIGAITESDIGPRLQNVGLSRIQNSFSPLT